MKFAIAHRDGAARRGKLELAHGRVDTPAFMPVGTYGTVKAMSPDELRTVGAQIGSETRSHRVCKAQLERGIGQHDEAPGLAVMRRWTPQRAFEDAFENGAGDRLIRETADRAPLADETVDSFGGNARLYLF